MSSISDVGGREPAGDKSTADLVRDLTEQLSHLARTEVRLAVREAREKARHAGLGVASLGAAGVLAGYGGAVVLAGLVLLLALAVPAWVAAMIVGVVLLLAAGAAAFVGKRQLAKGSPMPSVALEEAREDIEAVKEATRR